MSEQSAQQALGPFSFRDGDVIAGLLAEAGFPIHKVSGLLVHRPLTLARPAIRKEILASPYEGDLRTAGDEVIRLVVADVDAALEEFREGDSLVVPQEAHLFGTEKR